MYSRAAESKGPWRTVPRHACHSPLPPETRAEKPAHTGRRFAKRGWSRDIHVARRFAEGVAHTGCRFIKTVLRHACRAPFRWERFAEKSALSNAAFRFETAFGRLLSENRVPHENQSTEMQHYFGGKLPRESGAVKVVSACTKRPKARITVFLKARARAALRPAERRIMAAPSLKTGDCPHRGRAARHACRKKTAKAPFFALQPLGNSL